MCPLFVSRLALAALAAAMGWSVELALPRFQSLEDERQLS